MSPINSKNCNWCTYLLRYWDSELPEPTTYQDLQVGEIWIAPLPRSDDLMMIEVIGITKDRIHYHIWTSSSRIEREHSFPYKVISHWLACYEGKKISTTQAEALKGLWGATMGGTPHS